MIGPEPKVENSQEQTVGQKESVLGGELNAEVEVLRENGWEEVWVDPNPRSRQPVRAKVEGREVKLVLCLPSRKDDKHYVAYAGHDAGFLYFEEAPTPDEARSAFEQHASKGPILLVTKAGELVNPATGKSIRQDG